MSRSFLLLITALLEVATGLALLVSPLVPVALLLGVEVAVPETMLVARVAGAALLAIGVASGLSRRDSHSPTAYGLLVGVLIYDLAAAALLAYAGLGLNLAGVALWPAVAIHGALAAWCAVCLGAKTSSRSDGN